MISWQHLEKHVEVNDELAQYNRHIYFTPLLLCIPTLWYKWNHLDDVDDVDDVDDMMWMMWMI